MKESILDKYTPKKTKEIVGNEEQINKIRNFALNFKYSGKKAVLIYGPSGVGKTLSVYALADEFGFELVEINSSQNRAKDEIEKILGQACVSKSLLGGKKLILIDDVDCLSRKDKGMVSSIANIIKKTKAPVILTSQNPWKAGLLGLRNYCTLIKFEKISTLQIFKYLKYICKNENLPVGDAVLTKIAENSNGDIRAAINDLSVISKGDLSPSLNKRNIEVSIFDALNSIFKKRSLNCISAFECVNMPLNECMLWVCENIPNEYASINELTKAYYYISRADLFRARITKNQWYGFRYYQNILATAGVSFSKKKENPKFTRHSRPARIEKLWKSKAERNLKELIASKLSKRCHASKSKIKSQYFPLIKILLKKNKEIESIEFDEKEINALKSN